MTLDQAVVTRCAVATWPFWVAKVFSSWVAKVFSSWVAYLVVNMSTRIFLEYYQELERSAKDKNWGEMWMIPIVHIHVYHCIHCSGNQLSSSSYF